MLVITRGREREYPQPFYDRLGKIVMTKHHVGGHTNFRQSMLSNAKAFPDPVRPGMLGHCELDRCAGELQTNKQDLQLPAGISGAL